MLEETKNGGGRNSLRIWVAIFFLLLLTISIFWGKNTYEDRRRKIQLGSSISDLKALQNWWSQFTYDNPSILSENNDRLSKVSIVMIAEHSGVKKGNPALDRILRAHDRGNLIFYCVPKNGVILGEWTVEAKVLIVDTSGHVLNFPASSLGDGQNRRE